MSNRYYTTLGLAGMVNFIVSMTSGWDIAIFIVSLILLLLVAIPLGYQLYNKQQLGSMCISLDPYDLPQKRFSKKAELKISDTKLLVYVSPRKGTSWDRVNIRFFERKFSPRLNRIWRYENANPNIVNISDFRDVIQENQESVPTGYRYFESDTDKVGGYNGDYIPPLSVKGRELVWYDVYARANDFWEGFLSFEGTIDNRRAWARIKAEVKVARLYKIDGTVEKLTKKPFHNIFKKASQPIKKSEKGKA